MQNRPAITPFKHVLNIVKLSQNTKRDYWIIEVSKTSGYHLELLPEELRALEGTKDKA